MSFAKSLRAKTFLWTLLPIVLVFIAVLAATPRLVDEIARNIARQRDAELATISAARLSEKLGEPSRLLQNLAMTPQMQSMDRAQVRSSLEDAQQMFFLFDNGVAVYDAEGMRVAASGGTSELDERFPAPFEFAELRRTRRPVFSNIFRTSPRNESVILVAAPVILPDGTFGGAIAGLATLRYSLLGGLCAQILEFKKGRGGYAFLVDGEGQVIYHRHSNLLGKGAADYLPVREAISGKTGAILHNDGRGDTIVVGFAPVPNTKWGLITQERWDVIVSPVRRYWLLFMGALGIGGSIAVTMTFLGVSRVLKRIRSLTTGARRIAEGDFDYTIAAAGNDELQTLSEQFNEMARTLKQSYGELEHRVEERTADLAVSKEKAEQADQLKSTFLATMSHELRTPLNAIMGFTGILLQEIPGPINKEQRTQLNKVYSSSKHLLALINDILDLSKIEANKMTLSLELFDFKEVLDKVEDIISPLAEQKSLSLSVDAAPGVGTVYTDRRRMEQILLNVMDNAVKFTDKGTVAVTAEEENGVLRVSVRDTGIGISPGETGALFDAFTRVQQKGSAQQRSGTGLGLAICKKLVQLLGGDISVESEPAKGSTFRISVPINRRQASVQEAADGNEH